MTEITINVIVACLSSIITASVLGIPKLVRNIKANKNHPIVKRKRIIVAIVRYAVIFSLMFILFSCANFDKVLIVLLSILLIILSYCIADDVLLFRLIGAANISKEDSLREERECLMDDLVRFQSGEVQKKKYIDRIREIDKILESKSYLSY